MHAALADRHGNGEWKEYLPQPSLFGITVGLNALTLLWRASERTWGTPVAVTWVLAAIGLTVLTVLTVLYAFKWIVDRPRAMEELEHPVQGAFVALVGVAWMLGGQALLPLDRAAGAALIMAAAGFSLAVAMLIVGWFWQGKRDAGLALPSLYLPTVATGLVAGSSFAALGAPDMGAFPYGVGLLSWLGIESVLFHRFFHGDPIPTALRPTIGIQVAPPAVAAVAWINLFGAASPVVPVLLGYSIFQALVVARLGRWIYGQPFAYSFWGISFASAALPTGLVKLAAVSHSPTVHGLAIAFFIIGNAVLLALGAASVAKLVRRPS